MLTAYYESFGDPFDVLKIGHKPKPEPAEGEVRVKLAVSGLNPSDGKHRSGWTGQPMADDMIIPHNDGAGIIDKVGKGVSANRVGQRVWVYEAQQNGRAGGTAAQYTIIPSVKAVALPSDCCFDMGASLGVPAMTAHRCVLGDGPVFGQTILVAGGAGSVGRFAVQLAKWSGAQVIATVGNAEQAIVARNAGADEAIFYHDKNAAAKILRFAPEGIQRIIEVALFQNIDLDVAIAAPLASIVSFASATDRDQIQTIPARAMLTKALTLKWVHVYSMPDDAKQTAARDITSAIEAGFLTTPPLHRFPLADIASAHALVGIDGARKKILVDIPDQ